MLLITDYIKPGWSCTLSAIYTYISLSVLYNILFAYIYNHVTSSLMSIKVVLYNH